jgi:hypothetical protein
MAASAERYGFLLEYRAPFFVLCAEKLVLNKQISASGERRNDSRSLISMAAAAFFGQSAMATLLKISSSSE